MRFTSNDIAMMGDHTLTNKTLTDKHKLNS